MKTWMRFGIGAAALVVAVAVGTAAYAMRDDADDTPVIASDDGGGGAESACLVGTVDCNDTPGEGLNQSCPVGTPDCVDADLGGGAADCAADVVDCRDTGGGAAGMCLEGTTDCVDTPYGDFGELPERCASEGVDCVEPMPAPDCIFIEGQTPEESSVSCPSVGCEPAPMPEELVDPPVGAPEPKTDPPVDPVEPLVDPIPETQAGEPDTRGCLGVDPCTISSQQMCPPPDCAVSSDGTTTCYAIDPICAAPEDANEPVVCDDTVPPSEGEGSSGSGSTEPGSTEPQPAQ